MTPTVIGILAIAGLFLLIFLRVPIGIALAIAGTSGYYALSGLDTTLALLGSVPFEIAYNYDLSIIALFVLMGNYAMVSGMSRDLYALARGLVGHWPGGLASATVVGCAGFAAVSGSSLASAVTMGRVALTSRDGTLSLFTSASHGMRCRWRDLGDPNPTEHRLHHLCPADRGIHRTAVPGRCLARYIVDPPVHGHHRPHDARQS